MPCDQLILEPTRLDNILDIILTNSKYAFSDVEVDNPLGNSDHNTLIWNLKCSLKLTIKSMCVRNFSKLNFKKFGDRLEEINFLRCVINQPTAETKWNCFLSTLKSLISENFPLMISRKCSFDIKAKIRQLVKKKRRAWKNIKCLGV